MWLAYDIGTTGTKAALITADGTVTASAYRAYDTHTAAGGVMEQHAPDWWEAVVAATRELLPAQVTGIALTGQMQDVILLDEHGTPTRPVILYSDTRAHAEAAAYVDLVNLPALRTVTGNKQGEGADGLPAKLTWLAHHEPETLAGAVHLLLGAADYIAYRMTGATVTDTTTASTTGLMNMQARAPLPPEMLPEPARPLLPKLAQILPGGALAGTLSTPAADALGLAAGTPVHIGPGDAGATTLGADSGAPGKVYAYIGTSGWVGFSAPEPAAFDSGVITIAHPQPNTHIQVAPLLTAGGNLDYLLKLTQTPDYDALFDTLPPEPVNVIYLPYLNGERSPFVDPHARAAFIGLGTQSDASTLARAVLTGVAYGYRHALDELITGTVAQLTVTGGGTQSRAWMQIFADVLNVPVLIAADAENVGVRGAVIAASGETGMVPVAEVIAPQPTHRDFYDTQYGLFRQAYPALKPIFAALAR